MYSKQFFDQLLNFGDDWLVDDVRVNFISEEVDVFVSFVGKRGECPETLEMCPIYDRREERRWRHLDTMQFKTFINCRIPRVSSPVGVRTVKVPWTDGRERHTYLFERLAIDLLVATKNQTRTARLLRCGFNVVNRIIHLSVERGMARRPTGVPYTHLSIDEKSFKKGHSYVTVLSSPNAGCVVDVAEGRDKKAAKGLLEATVAPAQRGALKTVTADMWKVYMNSVAEVFPKAKLVHDRFHLIKYLNDGIDRVRRREVKHQDGLKNTRFVLLKNRGNLTDKQHITFEHIQAANYEVAKAWRVREDFKDILGRTTIEEAVSLFMKWGASVLRTKIKEMVKVAKIFNAHLNGVCNALVDGHSNAMAERLNGKIQEIKATARATAHLKTLGAQYSFSTVALTFTHRYNGRTKLHF